MFGDAETGQADEEVLIDQISYTMEWENSAKKACEEVPALFIGAAVSDMEEHAKNHGHAKITQEVIESFRKKLGMQGGDALVSAGKCGPPDYLLSGPSQKAKNKID